jgi:hypothetical protein
VANNELCGVGFEGGETVAEVCGRAVEGGAGEVTHRGDGGAECAAYLPFDGVELGVGEAAELEGEVFADKEPTDDPDSAGFS